MVGQLAAERTLDQRLLESTDGALQLLDRQRTLANE
jgi:hypothetical protein